MTALEARHFLAHAGAAVGGAVRVAIDGGRIASVAPVAAAPVPDRLVMPCLVNAHDHARPVRSSSLGAGGKPLEIWLHYLALLPALDPYAAAATSLARSALGGCGVVMVHHTRVQGLSPLPEEAAAIARAARDVGVKVGFAVALKDRNPIVYGSADPLLAQLPAEAQAVIRARLDRAPLPVAEQVALVDAVAESAGRPGFDVQYGPTGVQWCTPGLLRAVAQASERTGRRVHMHCLETRSQRAWADRAFPGGMLAFLDGIGLLSDRLTLAHCTHARPAELDLIAARGTTIAVNASSNLGLRSGVAPVADMVRRGCRVAIGLDGLALDEDDDALREMRLGHLLHGGTGFDVAVSRADVLAMATANGRHAVLNEAPRAVLEPGAPADLLSLDWAAVDDDRLRDDLDPLDLLFARATASHVAELRVDGRVVVDGGRLTGVDTAGLRRTLLDRIRTALRTEGVLRAALPLLEAAMRRDPHLICCA